MRNHHSVKISLDKASKKKKEKGTVEFEKIRKLLPHTYPFIFVDRVIHFKESEYIVCLKNISGNDPFFPGHFPDFAIMPGVLILEALAQATLLLVYISNPQLKNKLGVIGSVKARFLKPVVPGDQLIMEVHIEKLISTGAIVNAVAKVGNREVATSNMTFGIFDKGKLKG